VAFTPYVPPEQLIKDRSEYARKGIARGRSVVAIEYADGLLFLAENPSATLHKISEIYDRIAFAGVGKYSEFEDLRIAGVRLADLRGYSYGREDVTAKTIANAYSQALSGIFTQQMKPYEVELLVGQVGERPEENDLYHILFDGSVADEHGFVGMGGRAEDLTANLQEAYREGLSLPDAIRSGASSLSTVEERPLEAKTLEAAVLDRTRGRRKFRRLTEGEVAGILAG
jgi:proteasome alpha subunit